MSKATLSPARLDGTIGILPRHLGVTVKNTLLALGWITKLPAVDGTVVQGPLKKELDCKRVPTGRSR